MGALNSQILTWGYYLSVSKLLLFLSNSSTA